MEQSHEGLLPFALAQRVSEDNNCSVSEWIGRDCSLLFSKAFMATSEAGGPPVHACSQDRLAQTPD